METSILRRLCFAAMLLLLIITSANSAVWYVDGSVAASGIGTSWTSPVKTIQEAVNKASNIWIICTAPNDSIWVKQGVYTLSSEITVNKIVNIYGGFNGTETSASQRNFTANPTIIDGQLNTRCMKISSYCEIDGFTFRYGRNSGAGIYLDQVPTYDCFSTTLAVSIKNCIFYYNSALIGASSVPGGGIYDYKSSPYISNCTFQGNTGDRGGAIFSWQSSPVIDRCIFQTNHSLAAGSWGGGAICGDYLVYGTITNCLFDNNYSNSWGGALAYHMGYPAVTNCTFVNNGAALDGDAVHTNTAAPTFKNCIFWDDSVNEFYHSVGVSTPSVSYSNIRGGYPGTGNISLNPMFVAWNDFQLTHGSPCIDTGTNTGAPTVDLIGTTRPLDGNDSGTAVCDMGAYEHKWLDLMIWGWSTTPASPAVNQPFNINITIYNAGVIPTDRSFWVDWYANQPTPPGINDIGQKYAQIPNLNQKSYSYITLTHTYTTAGTYPTYVQVDTGNRISETQEGNNLSAVRNITVVERATLTANVYLQGSSRPSSGWNIPLRVALFTPGANVLTATPLAEYTQTTSRHILVARTTISNVIPGTYDITASSAHTLLNVKRNVTIAPGSSPSITLGTLLEGNGVQDNAINLDDLSLLALSWACDSADPDFNAQTDFDRNNIINMSDFNLLADNWGAVSPINIP